MTPAVPEKKLPQLRLELRRLRRLVLKSMISNNETVATCGGVISNLSIAPLRIPNGRRRRKLNSLQRPAFPRGFAFDAIEPRLWANPARPFDSLKDSAG